MNLAESLLKEFEAACNDALGLENVDFDLTIAKDNKHGHFCANIAFILAKRLRKSPEHVAKILIDHLKSSSIINNIEVAGSGFINIWLKNHAWSAFLERIIKDGKNFGFSDQSKDKESIHLEFVSANPTGPLHLGHIRGAAIFDSIAEVLKKSGFSVTKEYYINDAGAQIETLMNSVFFRYQESKNNLQNSDFPDGFYPGEYVKEIANTLIKKYDKQDLDCAQEKFIGKFRSECVDLIMESIKSDLKKLEIDYDVFVKESDLHQKSYVEKAVNFLKSKNLIKEDLLEKPKGKVKEWQERSQMVFVAKKFGDDQNRALKKSDGSWTYFASDIAYHFYKIERGFNKMIVGLGADHAGYVKRLEGVVKALSDGKSKIDVHLYNIVNLFKGKTPIKLSKRNGNIVGIDDIARMYISPQELRFALLTKGPESVLDFDIEKFAETSDDNPIFYVQYASARCSSVLKKFQGNLTDLKPDVSLLKLDQEWDLIKSLTRWPSVIETVIKTFQVHKVVFYAQEIAEKLHALWNLGIRDKNARFVIEGNHNLTKARIALIFATKNTLKSVLSVLKIDAVDQM